MKRITQKEWYWDSLEVQELRSHIIASRGHVVVTLVKNGNEIFMWLRSKDFKYTYEWGRNTRDSRTLWQLECQKSRLINEGFKINWVNYQLILQMYSEYFNEKFT